MKVVFDKLVAFWVLAILSPVLVLVALCIMIDDPGTPFFKQKRVGRLGQTFGMYKFRSMKLDAAKSGPYFTQENDPRITKVGRFIRRTSLDELPQLLNVLLGDMSLVGPRPNVPAQKEGYDLEQWNLRNTVKPGITGLAQATLRSDATPEQRTKLDLEYVKNQSFKLDLKIVLMTIQQVINKGGN